jgi:pyrroloquinoline quinone (PQQ) biosynthesis protein C
MTFFERLQDDTAPERAQLLSTGIIRDAVRGRIRLEQYLAFLTQAYYHVRHTVPLLMACGARLPRRLGWLREALAHYIAEELGHDDWILSDITACGGDGERVRIGSPAFETEVMVACAYHQVDRGNAAGFLGMVHVLEGTSIAVAASAAAAIQRALDLPAAAFSYLTSHGSLDVQHVRTFERLVNRLEDRDDQDAVVHCARSFYRLYGDIFRALPAFDARPVQDAA